jgi:hypothetical protein
MSDAVPTRHFGLPFSGGTHVQTWRGSHSGPRELEIAHQMGDANGHSISEQTETHDISETGISFYLKNSMWVHTHLTLRIASSSLFGRLHTATAKVVRVQIDPSAGQLVAARFDD